MLLTTEETVTPNPPGAKSSTPTEDTLLISRLNKLPDTDRGNAEAVLELKGRDIKYIKETDKWAFWCDSGWSIDAEPQVTECFVQAARSRLKAAREIAVSGEDAAKMKEAATKREKRITFARQSENRGKIKAAMETFANIPSAQISIEDFDHDPWLLGLPGELVIDLKVPKIRKKARNDMTSLTAGYIDSEATKDILTRDLKGSRWERFLREIFLEDKEMIRWIQKAVGYCLTGDTSEQVFFLCVGQGRNGKSLFLTILSALLGSYSSNASFLTFDANRRTEQTNDLARLKGKRLVTILESNEDRFLDEGRIKAATGSDKLTSRFNYKEFFDYLPGFKIWLATNHEPRIRQNDEGIWRRVILIPFDARFQGNGDDQKLNEKLKVEVKNGNVLSWALQGLKMWLEEGLGELPERVKRATEEYRKDSDHIGQWIGEELEQEEGEEVWFNRVYENYRNYMREHGHKPMGDAKLGKELRRRGFEIKAGSGNKRKIMGWRISLESEILLGVL